MCCKYYTFPIYNWGGVLGSLHARHCQRYVSMCVDSESCTKSKLMFLLFFCDACITCLRMSAVAVRSCCSSPEPDREPSPPPVSFVWCTGSFSFCFVAVYLCKYDFSELTSKDSLVLSLAMISNFAKVLPFLCFSPRINKLLHSEFI